jgi:hypothetical protein
MNRLVVIVLFLPVLSTGCQRIPDSASAPAVESGPDWFEDVTDKWGLDFVHDAGPLDGTYPLPQTTGSGAALFDCDGDGRLDIYLLNNGGPKGRPNQLYRQRKDGTFVNASKDSGLDFAGYCMGAAVGDINNDGRPDLLVTLVGSVRLFLNRGGGKFRDITKEAGLDNPVWAASAAFFDYDRDGRLDLVVVNYVDFDPSWRCTSTRGQWDYCSPNVFPPTVSRLFHNEGAKDGVPIFKDVTMSSGLGKVPGPGLGVYCADFDGDGWPDIFVANDGKPNHLWINRKNGTFTEEAVLRGLAYDGMGRAQAGMGVAFADVDGDGLLDVFVTHLTEEQHTLWKQGPRGLFSDRSRQARLSAPAWRSTGFGTALLDLDNDGWPDLVIANGRAARGPAVEASSLGEHWGPYGERNQVFANNGAGQFKDISLSNPDFCGRVNVARGLAVGDIDGDGGLDILLTTAGGRARLFRNKAADRGHWLSVRAVDRAGRRDALGAEVVVHTAARRQIRVLQTADSYLSASEAAVHFGLGKEERYEKIEVLWPDGTRERFEGGKADKVRRLRQGTGKPMEAPNRAATVGERLPRK